MFNVLYTLPAVIYLMLAMPAHTARFDIILYYELENPSRSPVHYCLQSADDDILCT